MGDEFYMNRCLKLAELGAGYVSPNPMVGAIVMHNNTIIGEGYHKKCGDPHAEVNAINAVTDPSLLKESTIYVNLEPCAHFGKTPPCSELIIAKKIPKVVIGCMDNHSKVSGKGIAKMEAAGCDVKVGVLEAESLSLNRRFFTFHNKKRPYVILKWAQSQEGFMDINRTNGQKGVFWITEKETRTLVHKWRHEEAGILIGKNTVINDNPELTVRDFLGNSPTRFIVDPSDVIALSNYKIGNSPPDTYKIKSATIDSILKEVFSKQILSLLVEGGRFTLNKFIESGTWDELRIITGARNLESGQLAPVIQGKLESTFDYGKDQVQIFLND